MDDPNLAISFNEGLFPQHRVGSLVKQSGNIPSLRVRGVGPETLNPQDLELEVFTLH